MHQTLSSILASSCYLGAALFILRTFRSDYQQPGVSARYRSIALALASAGAVLHAIGLSDLLPHENQALNFSLISAASAAMLAMVTALIASALLRPVEKLGIVIFPMAALVLLARPLLPDEMHLLHEHAWPMKLHIITSMLAFSFMSIAALQAILLALQDWRLRSHHAGGMLRSLPPLQTMENLLFQMISCGLVLLSASLITGFLFLDDLFAQHLAHKTVFSLLAWLIFAALLIGRRARGWRGLIAIRWTLAGFMLLVLAYFGSKLVLQWILHRN